MSSHPKLYIVEADHDLREMLGIVLERVFEIGDRLESDLEDFESISRCMPDLIIIDLESENLHLLDRLRGCEETRTIPVFALSRSWVFTGLNVDESIEELFGIDLGPPAEDWTLLPEKDNPDKPYDDDYFSDKLN